MKKQTHLSNAVEITEGDPKLDQAVKELLADKQVLARILKRTVVEFKDVEIPEIMDAIEGKPEVEKVSIVPGLTNLPKSTDKIEGGNTESVILGENAYTFDVKFHAWAPSNKKDLLEFGIKIILDLEAQREYYLGYDIVIRGIYYASRLISSQYGVEFTGEGYGEIKKVYSIWICMEPPKYGTNSIINFKMEPEVLYGKFPVEKVLQMKYDLIDVVMVFISAPEDVDKDDLCGMLEVLLDKELGKEEKLNRLEADYQMKKTVELESEVTKMCDYSVGIAKENFAKGEIKGIEKGIEKGQNLLVKAIRLLREGKNDEYILKEGIDEHTLELAKACK